MMETQKTWMTWTGRVVSAFPVLMLVLSGVMKVTHNAQAVAGFAGKYGWQLPLLTPIGVVELLCAEPEERESRKKSSVADLFR